MSGPMMPSREIVPAAPNPSPAITSTARPDVADFRRLVRRRRFWLWGGILFGIVGAGAYCWWTKTLYEAEARLLILPRETSLNPQIATPTTSSVRQEWDDLLATQADVLQSERIVSAALSGPAANRLASIESAKQDDQTPVEYVIEQLDVARGGKGAAKGAHVLHVTFRHPSATDAVAILDSVVQEYELFLQEQFATEGKKAAELLHRLTHDVKEELTKAEDEYREFRKQTRLLSEGGESSNPHEVNLAALHQEIFDLRARLLKTKTRREELAHGFAEIREEDASPLQFLGLLNQTDIARIGKLVELQRGDSNTEAFMSQQPTRVEAARRESELVDLESRRSELLQRRGKHHPEVLQLDKQIADVRNFLQETQSSVTVDAAERFSAEDLLETYLRSLQNDIREMEKSVEGLEELQELEAEAAKQLIQDELKAEALRKEITRHEQIRDSLLTNLQDVNLATDYGGFVTEVIEEANAREPVWPLPGFLLPFGAFAGLMLGFVGALWRESMDNEFADLDDISSTLRIPVFASIPAWSSSESPIRMGKEDFETFRSLRTMLHFRLNTDGGRIVQATSPAPQDGKTTVLVNLAIAFAQLRKKVLVIDADLRRPSLHRALDLGQRAGLTEVMAGEIDTYDAIVSTGIDSLWAMPSGSIPPNPAELLALPAFRVMLESLAEKYDIILVDSPPVLAVSDPAVIAPCMDAVVLVMRNSSRAKLLTLRAKQALEAVRAPLLGVIPNRVRAQDRQQYGTFDYGQYQPVVEESNLRRQLPKDDANTKATVEIS